MKIMAEARHNRMMEVTRGAILSSIGPDDKVHVWWTGKRGDAALSGQVTVAGPTGDDDSQTFRISDASPREVGLLNAALFKSGAEGEGESGEAGAGDKPA